jgi:hypothetical protein
VAFSWRMSNMALNALSMHDAWASLVSVTHHGECLSVACLNVRNDTHVVAVDG